MDVISFGSLFLEVVFGEVERLPRPGEEVWLSSFAFSCGGGAITSAVAARRVGASAGLGTLLGDDLGSRVAVEYATREGVDLSPSQRVEGPAVGVTVVLNFDSDRAFISHLPRRPATAVDELTRWAQVVEELRPRWCYLHAVPEAPCFLRRARELGAQLAVDVSIDQVEATREEVIECAKLADLFLPNQDELKLVTGCEELETAIGRARAWAPRMAVKCGPEGAIAVEAGRTTIVKDGLADVEVKDRTGAGDAFAGALIGSLVRGATFLQAVAAGNSAGSHAVARLGAAGEVQV
jgi:sugar/nucleoside kinase (ribokinase family)